MNFRHEYKYIVSAAEIAVLKERIKHIMTLDRNAGSAGMYNIRSVYFDDMYDRCLWENANSFDNRSKYRIRIYNASDERIKLELKQSIRGKKLKTSDRLTRECADNLIAGRVIRNAAGNAYQPCRVLPRLCADMMINRMHPVIIVEYDRIPYIYNDGNVRVTFDMNISSSKNTDEFFDEKIAKRPIMPAAMHLMEVKFDDYLPDIIYRALQIDNLRPTTFSKYFLCRQYSL